MRSPYLLCSGDADAVIKNVVTILSKYDADICPKKEAKMIRTNVILSILTIVGN